MTKPQDLLFEIGTEELPATNLADIFETAWAQNTDNLLEVRFKKALEEKRLAFGACRVWATPRRLIFFAEGVAGAQTPRENLIRVLSKEEAYSNDAPTEKFLTILKHRGASVRDTFIGDWNGRPYVFIKKPEPALKTGAVLPDVCGALVKSLAFPKNMKWGDNWEDGGELYFPRPIRNYLCFYGTQKLFFRIAGRAVENKTVVFSDGRWTAYPVKNPAAYWKILSKHGIIADPAERKKTLVRILEKLAKASRAKLYDDPFLLGEVNFLVENPQALAAAFDGQFLKLPLEVLVVSMARKQRLFGMLGADGKVLPRFLAVVDGDHASRAMRAISENMEHILHAKLQDSLFFYKEDTKSAFGSKLVELKNLVFLKGAGSMFDKTNRLVKLAKRFGSALGLGENLERACALSKADLLTCMVGEFPELQGIMGKYYARDSEREEVAEAIAEQYLPRTAEDRLPATLCGSLLSVFDKTDLVAACFRLELEPTSSLDPYGVRRSATAVLKILTDKKIDISLSELLSRALEGLGFTGKQDSINFEKLTGFFKDRFQALMVDRGCRQDVTEAVLASGFDSPYEACRRVRTLSALLEKDYFPRAWKVVERTANILKGSKETPAGAVEPSFFQEEVERRAWESYGRSRRGVEEAAGKGDFDRATSLYAGAFFDILEEFFEKVFVNDKNPDIRKNRLALLRAIKELYTANIADLSVISNPVSAKRRGEIRPQVAVWTDPSATCGGE